MTAERHKRHLRILELIATRAIETQDDLVDALAAEGWEVTQSSISRDIAALRLVKIDGIYARVSRVNRAAQDPDLQRVSDGVLMANVVGENLVVLHTPPGEASRVAAAMDRLSWSEIVGTIAGDDTIFVAVRGAVEQRTVVKKLKGLGASP